jgi:hypothetical protein
MSRKQQGQSPSPPRPQFNISATTITRQNAKHKRVRRSGKTYLQILAISLNPLKPRKS